MADGLTISGTAANPISIRGVGVSRPVFDATGRTVDGVRPNPRAVFQVETGSAAEPGEVQRTAVVSAGRCSPWVTNLAGTRDAPQITDCR